MIAPKDRNSSRLDLRRTNEPPELPPLPLPLPPRPEAFPPRPNTSTPAIPRPMTNQQQLFPHATVQFVAEEAQQPAAGSRSEIIIEITDDGILLVSEDIEALDKFETLLRQFMPINAGLGESKITVFYLKYAKADVAASLIQQILSGGAGSSSSSIGSLMGDITGNLMGGGGGLMGMLLGTGGDAGGDTLGTTFEATSTVSIVADPRLNALVVQAVEEDVAMIEDLLGVIDKEGSITDVETAGKPRLIPVIYTSAESIANTVKEVYSDRLRTSSSRGQSQQRGGNDDIMKMLQSMRGGGGGAGGGRGGSSAAKSEPAKMSIGVDTESNSIVVAAPEPLFLEVQELVHQLDSANIQSQDSLEVRTLRLTNPEVVTVQSAPPNWSVESLLAGVATAEPHYHALIDVGALVTGLSNKGVASHLLSHLGAWCEGCVFLDEQDEKMILIKCSIGKDGDPAFDSGIKDNRFLCKPGYVLGDFFYFNIVVI